MKSKKQNLNIPHQAQHIRIILCNNFYFKQPVLIFWTNFAQKSYFEFSLGTNFQTILTFRTKFAGEENLRSKRENFNIAIGFRVLELVNNQ